MMNMSVIGVYEIIKPLFLFVIGMVVYSVFVFKFYRFLAKKDIIKLDLKKYNTAKHSFLHKFIAVIFYIIKYLVIMPISIFFWFAILTCLLSFLTKNQPLESILLVSIALVSAVRITAYYNEDLSKDLAKMLPFALLGVFLIDVTYFNFSTSLNALKDVFNVIPLLVYYLLFTVLLELALRIAYAISSLFKSKKKKRSDSISNDDN